MGRVLRVLLGDVVDFRNHADTRMTEKHYAHLAPSYVADTIRAHFPNAWHRGRGSRHHNWTTKEVVPALRSRLARTAYESLLRLGLKGPWLQ